MWHLSLKGGCLFEGGVHLKNGHNKKVFPFHLTVYFLFIRLHTTSISVPCFSLKSMIHSVCVCGGGGGRGGGCLLYM